MSEADDGTAPVYDELLERVYIERSKAGRGNLQNRRRLWRFCSRAFREWHGLHLLADAPIIVERRLSNREMVEWLRLAEDMPAVARDVLKLQKQAAVRGEKIVLSEMRWPDGRREMLAELHQFALVAAQRELEAARKAQAQAVRNEVHFANYVQRCDHRDKMVLAITRVVDELTDQLHALNAAGRAERQSQRAQVATAVTP